MYTKHLNLRLFVMLAVLVLSAFPRRSGSDIAPRTPVDQAFPATVTAVAPASAHGFENFERFNVTLDNLCTEWLDENTLSCNGLQGPGLVIDGCAYSCHPNSRMIWIDRGFEGVRSKCIASDPYIVTLDRRLTLNYDAPVRNVRFTLCAFNGYPDVAQLRVLDSSGFEIKRIGPLTLPNADPIAIEIHGDDIRTIHIQGSRHSWSPILDNHSFGDGPSLTAVGTCPGPMTFTVEGGSGTYALAYGAAGSTTILTGRCAGTVLSLSSPLQLGTISGPVTVNLPAACRRWTWRTARSRTP